VGGEDILRWPSFAEFAGHHSRGLACYRSKDWQGALESFSKAEKSMPPGLDVSAVYRLYQKRIEDYSTAAPISDWTGIEVATEK
jgi:adenylate cyclase